MHRCDNADSAGTAVGAFDASVAVYRDENPPTYDATQGRHTEMNAIQEEIANVIRAEGIVLNTDTETVAQMTQLNAAINHKLTGANIINDSGMAGATIQNALNDAAVSFNAIDVQLAADSADLVTETNSRISNDNLLAATITNVNNNRIAAENNIIARIIPLEGDVVQVSGTLEVYGYSANEYCAFNAMIRRMRGDYGTMEEVSLFLAYDILETSIGNTLGIVSASIPAALRPTVDTFAAILVYDSDDQLAPVGASIKITASGDWVIHKTTVSTYVGSFSDSPNSKGFPKQKILYHKS